MRRADQVMAAHIRDGNLGGDGYMEYIAALDTVADLPGADAYAAAVASARLTAALVYKRAEKEVEQALTQSLDALEPLHFERLTAAASASAAHPSLQAYFERELSAIAAAHPDHGERVRAAEFGRRVRANVHRKFG
ncbi:MAG: hypothetical protein Tsb0020_23340 [Haliangiales bacterium]